MKKVAIITGASGGIGGEIAIKLAKDYNLVLSYCFNEKKAKNIANICENLGAKVLLLKCDLKNEDDIKNLVDKTMVEFGKIDCLVNNAGVSSDHLFQEKTVEIFRNTLEVNLIGTFLMSKYVGEKMLENKNGKIINISSTNGSNTYFPMCLDYDASKAGINSLTHNLAVQFAPYVNVNAVAPGFIATENEIKDMDEDYIESEVDKIMVKRIGKPEDVANLVKFLLSDEASFINNQIISIDGGFYGSI